MSSLLVQCLFYRQSCFFHNQLTRAPYLSICAALESSNILECYLELGFLMKDNISRICCSLRSCLLLSVCPPPLLRILVHLHWWHTLPQAARGQHDVLLSVLIAAVPTAPGGLPRSRDLCASAMLKQLFPSPVLLLKIQIGASG